MVTPVVVINGLGAPRVAALAYGLALRSRGFRVFTAPQRLLGYGDIRLASELVAGEVERVRRHTGSDKVHLVGMSLGGLIGLYYLKCAGGASSVERFVSVGGPLNGSALARVLDLVPSRVAHAMAQTSPAHALMREVRDAATPEGVRMFSVGTRGDFITPRASWDAAGCEPIETPHGVFPLGHWMLFTHPGNHDMVARCLTVV